MKSLETLMTELGIAEFIPQISEYRDAIYVEKAAELQIVQQKLDVLQGLYDRMVDKVDEVLASGDPDQYEALAVEFLTPEKEKEKQALEAEIAERQAKLAELNG